MTTLFDVLWWILILLFVGDKTVNLILLRRQAKALRAKTRKRHEWHARENP